jgi:DNA-binding NarL/FixJ family response regulator
LILHRVLLIDDLPVALNMLEQAVREAFGNVGIERAEGVAASRRLLAADGAGFDLALVDLHLGDGHGVDVIQMLASKQPACTVVVATIFDDDDHLFQALQAGAQGYVLKDRAPSWLAAQLRGIGDGQPPLSPAIARRLLRHFRSVAGSIGASYASSPMQDGLGLQTRSVHQHPRLTERSQPHPVSPTERLTLPTEPLTAREREVFGLLAQGVNVAYIARALGISRHTVGDHVKNLYRKLNISSRAQAALHARGLGLA